MIEGGVGMETVRVGIQCMVWEGMGGAESRSECGRCWDESVRGEGGHRAGREKATGRNDSSSLGIGDRGKPGPRLIRSVARTKQATCEDTTQLCGIATWK